MGVLCSECGYTPFQVEMMSIREMSIILNAYQQRVHREYRWQAENTRSISFFAAFGYLKKGIKRPDQLYRLPWEIEEKAEQLREKTPENVRELWARGEFTEGAKRIFARFPDRPVPSGQRLTKAEARSELMKLNTRRSNHG